MKVFINVLVGTFCILAVSYAIFIAVLDPFYVFHMPLGGMEPVQTNKAHYVARGLIRNADYDILICGSSMVENFRIDDVNDIFYGEGGNDRCLKVVQHGSYSNDLRISLEAAADAGKAEVIIMALDTSVFAKPDDGYRIGGLPSYAQVGPSLFNIWEYLLNKDVFQNAADLAIKNAVGGVEGQDNWWIIPDESCSRENLLAAYKSDILDRGFIEFDSEKAWNNLKNIEEGVEACQNKGIEIKFFIPPYSIANWDCRDYRLEMETYKEIWRKLLGYPNVSLYALQFDGDIITDFDNYRNTGHYSGEVCREILQCIKGGRHRLTLDNVDDEVEGFIRLLDGYDWENLRNSAAVAVGNVRKAFGWRVTVGSYCKFNCCAV